MNTDDPTKDDVDAAIQRVCQVGACLEIVAKFIASGDYDMERFSWHVGETAEMLREQLSDAYCTLNNTNVTVIVKEARG